MATDPKDWLENYGDYLYRFALSRLHDREAAEDAVQETFLAAIRGLDSYTGDVEVKYWLRGILRNKTVDHIRRAVREMPLAELTDYDEPPSRLRSIFGIPARKVESWSFDPASVCENKEFWDVFSSCLSKIKSPLREVYTLKEIEGSATDEICREFGITPNNLWVMVHRARKQLKRCLLRNWGA